jgi:hypothetical protein
MYITRLIIRTILFHIICIISFSLIYFSLDDSFVPINTNQNYTLRTEFIDFLSLSVAIQASLGLTFLQPINMYSKVAMLAQQILLISTHVITLFIFAV